MPRSKRERSRLTFTSFCAVIIGTSFVARTRTVLAQNLEQTVYSDVFDEVKSWLDSKRTQLQGSAFVSYDSNGGPYPSDVYKYDDFIRVLESISVSGVGGGGNDMRFYLGADGKGALYGLVNVAAFLAHAMSISIKFDACDEINQDDFRGNNELAISNSCGQWGRNYEDEVCKGKSRSMTCSVDENAAITAVSVFKNGNSTPPLFQCKPKQSNDDFAGYWDSETDTLTIDAYANRYGRTDIQGCCWWGRGILMTRGTCNFGRINHYLGINAVSMGYVNFYDVDFCVYPEVVCNSPYSKDLRWIVGYFEWVDKVQTYNRTRSYMDELDSLIENGFNETSAFIDVVGWALPVSCAEASARCDPSIDLKLIDERRDNFLTLIDVLALADLLPEPTTTTTEATTTTMSYISFGNGTVAPPKVWYPISFESTYEDGYCVNVFPTPSNLALYQSQLECCVEFFNEQVNGKCLNQVQWTEAPMNSMPIESLPRNPSKRPTPQPDPPTNSPEDHPTYEPTVDLIILPPSSAFERDYIFAIGCMIVPIFIFLWTT